MTAESKGRVTHHAARTIGKRTQNDWFADAEDDKELESLKREIESWNSNSQNNKVELVRVEVTPV